MCQYVYSHTMHESGHYKVCFGAEDTVLEGSKTSYSLRQAESFFVKVDIEASRS